MGYKEGEKVRKQYVVGTTVGTESMEESEANVGELNSDMCLLELEQFQHSRVILNVGVENLKPVPPTS